MPEAFAPILEMIVDYKFVIAAVPFVIAGLLALSAWSRWVFTYFEVDEYGLTRKLGPFYGNTIPLRAIQV
jgi:hypothetical protein